MLVKDFSISSAEWKVMRVVWTLGEVTSKDVIDELGDENDWKATTIKTLLSRLVEKKILVNEKIGRINHYTALIGEQDAMDTSATVLFDNMCAMRVGAVLNDVIDQRELSQTDIDSMIEILQQKKQTAPEEVACNCLK